MLPSGFVELVPLVQAASLMMLLALETRAVVPHKSGLSFFFVLWRENGHIHLVKSMLEGQTDQSLNPVSAT